MGCSQAYGDSIQSTTEKITRLRCISLSKSGNSSRKYLGPKKLFHSKLIYFKTPIKSITKNTQLPKATQYPESPTYGLVHNKSLKAINISTNKYNEDSKINSKSNLTSTIVNSYTLIPYTKHLINPTYT